jgi:hypothetical protein
MKFGQFCGLLADEMDLPHSDFLMAAELLFATQSEGPTEADYFVLPDRAVSVKDAAMLVCLIIAMDQRNADLSQCAEAASDISARGQNLSLLVQAIESGQQARLDISARLEAQVTVPQKLTAQISRLVRPISHLRSV